MSATERPWFASFMRMNKSAWAKLNIGGVTIVRTAAGDVIAAVWANDDGDEKDNAALIVKAVNCHDELVVALAELAAAINDGLCNSGTPAFSGPERLDEALTKAAAVLAIARGEQP